MSISRTYTSFTQKEIRQLFQAAKRVVKEQELTILLAPTHKDFGRLLVIIPRAVGNAPVRNKLRRQLKSIFFEKRFFEYNLDCAIITRPGASNIPFARLTDLMQRAFHSTNVQESTTNAR